MRILVTGATGFIGRHLTQALCDRKNSVRILARPASQTDPLEALGAEVVEGDITDYSSVANAVDTCQQVYHLAGQPSMKQSSKGSMYAANVVGTENIARAATEAGVERLVYGSSAGVYGIIKHPPADETSPTVPNTVYRQSKLLGERVLLSQRQASGLPVVIARLSTVLGAGSLNLLGFCRAIATGKFRIIGKGENYVHTTHVLDAVDGLLKCAQTPDIEGRCYNIASQTPTRFGRFIHLIAQEIDAQVAQPNQPVLPFQLYFSTAQFVRSVSGFELPRSHQYEMFLTSRSLSTEKAQKELNFRPSIPIETGIKETIQHYRDTGHL